MPNDSIHLAESGRLAKLVLGPMTGPMPGPTLATAVMEPEMAVRGSRPMAASRAAISKMMAK
ncbi:hypothetical protein D3C86_1930470 [compost metagenome]